MNKQTNAIQDKQETLILDFINKHIDSNDIDYKIIIDYIKDNTNNNEEYAKLSYKLIGVLYSRIYTSEKVLDIFNKNNKDKGYVNYEDIFNIESERSKELKELMFTDMLKDNIKKINKNDTDKYILELKGLTDNEYKFMLFFTSKIFMSNILKTIFSNNDNKPSKDK